jgi:hypothetical protein
MAIPCNQTYTVSKSLVVTVRSPSEAPVIIAPTQVVAVAGQVFSLRRGRLRFITSNSRCSGG